MVVCDSISGRRSTSTTDHVFLVVFGASSQNDNDGLVEVHASTRIGISSRCTATMPPQSTGLRQRYVSAITVNDPPVCCNAVVDGLVDSFFPRLAAIDAASTCWRTAIFGRRGRRQLQEIFSMKRSSSAYEK